MRAASRPAARDWTVTRIAGYGEGRRSPGCDGYGRHVYVRWSGNRHILWRKWKTPAEGRVIVVHHFVTENDCAGHWRIVSSTVRAPTTYGRGAKRGIPGSRAAA
jgi:hypothetical protein